MIDFKKHPELKFFYHPESDSYFLKEAGNWLNEFEGQLCHEVELEDIPKEVVRDLMSGFVIKSRDFKEEFEQFNILSYKFQDLKAICQNNTVISNSEFASWVKGALSIQEELKSLVHKVARKIKQ